MMQLILDTERSGDIKTSMSTRLETTVNGDISDLKRDISQANKEITLNTEDETNNKTEKSLTTKTVTPIDVEQSEIREEKSTNRNNNLADNEEIQKKDNLIVNGIQNIVNDNTANDRKTKQDDSNKFNKENTIFEMQFENNLEINDDSKAEHNSTNTDILCLTGAEKSMKKNIDLINNQQAKHGETEIDLQKTLNDVTEKQSKEAKVDIVKQKSTMTQSSCDETAKIVDNEGVTKIFNNKITDKLKDHDNITKSTATDLEIKSTSGEVQSAINDSEQTIPSTEKKSLISHDQKVTVKTDIQVVTVEDAPTKNNDLEDAQSCATITSITNYNRNDSMERNTTNNIELTSENDKHSEDTTMNGNEDKTPNENTIQLGKSLPEDTNNLKSDTIIQKSLVPDLDETLKDVPSTSEQNSNDVVPEVSQQLKLIEENQDTLARSSMESDDTTIQVDEEAVQPDDNVTTCENKDNDVMEIDDDEVFDVDGEEMCGENGTSTNISAKEVSSKVTNNVEITNKDLAKVSGEKNNINNVSSEEVAQKTLFITEIQMDIDASKPTSKASDKVNILEEDDIKIIENKTDEVTNTEQTNAISPFQLETNTLPVVCKLSNTLDILSEEEDEVPAVEATKNNNSVAEKQCIDIDDDDDIMVIEEDSTPQETHNENLKEEILSKEPQPKPNDSNSPETDEKEISTINAAELSPEINEKVSTDSYVTELEKEKPEKKRPLLPDNFLKTAKKNLADMTRDELEDFCILKIVESIVDRSNLSDIKTKIKSMAQNIEEYKKKAFMLTKQNRDLQVVLKSVQEEQKRRTNTAIQPLKITRSVGMQVLMTDKVDTRKKGPIPCQSNTSTAVSRPLRSTSNSTKNAKTPANPVNIPIPRLVPANSPAKTPTSVAPTNTGKTASPNGLRNNPSPIQKAPEKRTHTRMQAATSVTVDLTDDEPPSKVPAKNAPLPPVRLVSPQNLLAQQRQFGQPLNSPRKVYIPISGPPAQNIRPGQTVFLKNVGPNSHQRPRLPGITNRGQPTAMKIQPRHPAPLPEVVKQYTPSTWKPIPPAPDLKLSKVENGIVISWKIDGYPENDCEPIISYQLYAYQETSSPPSTALWKKIGDVKALPLPMACTLTQFMAGFKYYFAVRAVDARSRLGPFSLPGSILLLNKV